MTSLGIVIKVWSGKLLFFSQFSPHRSKKGGFLPSLRAYGHIYIKHHRIKTLSICTLYAKQNAKCCILALQKWEFRPRQILKPKNKQRARSPVEQKLTLTDIRELIHIFPASPAVSWTRCLMKRDQFWPVDGCTFEGPSIHMFFPSRMMRGHPCSHRRMDL